MELKTTESLLNCTKLNKRAKNCKVSQITIAVVRLHFKTANSFIVSGSYRNFIPFLKNK